MENSYVNTVHLEGNELVKEEENAKSQEADVLRLFSQFPRKMMTPFEVKHNIELYFKKQYDLNSVRRAITNLTEKGLLVKTDKRKMGWKGKMNYCWQKAIRKATQQVLF